MHPRQFSDKLTHLLPPRGLMALTNGIELVSLWRWTRLSLLVGVVVGLVASALYYALELAESLLLYRLGGLQQPPFGESGHMVAHAERAPVWWLLFLLPALGGLVAGLVLWRFSPEARGTGVDPVLDAYHNDNRSKRVGLRAGIVKMIATICTLGTGGSAGREGPMVQIGASFGSYVARRLKLRARERRLLLLAAAAGGISALFRTPLGAALWSLEVLYRDDFESEGLFPCLISSVTAYSIFTTFFGQGSLFSVPVSYEFQPTQLVFYAGLGLACAPLAVLWLNIRNYQYRFWSGLRAPEWLKPALGGLLLGALGLVLPWVFAAGYGWMQDALRPIDDPARQLPVGYEGFALLLGIAVAKMIATALTTCSGGSGGLFAPSLFIGGFIGGAFGLLFHELAPAVVTQPGSFVLVGMAAFYASIGRVPIATIILVSELFSSYDLLVPLMFTEMITLLLMRRYSLYEKQVENALASPAHLADFTVDVLEKLYVRDHYTQGRASETISATMNVRDFLHHVSVTADSFFVVHNQKRELVGIVSLSNVRSVVAEQEFLDIVLVTDAMWPIQTLAPDTNLRDALRIFLESGYDHLPVVDICEPTRVMGMLSQQQIFAAYNAEMLRRRLSDDPTQQITVPPPL